MTATSLASLAPEARGLARVREAVSDAMAIATRDLIALIRTPQLLVFSTIQPVIFVLLFRYVFGGAIDPPGNTPYVDFLMPGIFVQTVVFGTMGTAIGLATDIKSGLLERFRSLPMARSALLFGRTGADLARNVFVVVLMAAVGFAVGFRIHTSPLAFAGAMALVLAFGYVFSWVMATVGLLTRDPESAQAAAFPAMAPLVFASSAFVPIESMPGWLQGWAEYQPVSVTANAVRGIVLGQDAGGDVLKCLAWCVVLLALFVPVAVRRYRTTV
jgi:ABC-2 type transport system permease protein/oleandomycin transport system permease protein